MVITTCAVGATLTPFLTSKLNSICGSQPRKEQGTPCLLHSWSHPSAFLFLHETGLSCVCRIFWSGLIYDDEEGILRTVIERASYSFHLCLCNKYLLTDACGIAYQALGLGLATQRKVNDFFPLGCFLSNGGKTHYIICDFAQFVRYKMKIRGSLLKSY